MTKKKTEKEKAANKKAAAKKTAAAKKGGSNLPVKAAALTSAQQEKNWKDAIAELISRRKSMVANVLEFHYDAGKFCIQLVDERSKQPGQRKYGSHLVEDLGVEIESSPTTIHYCTRFAAMFTRAQVKALQDKEWPWRQVQPLLAIEDPKERARFQKDWESGKHTGCEALREAVSEHNKKEREAGKRKDNRGKRSGFMEAAKTAASALTHAGGEILPTFIKAVSEFAALSEELEDKKREKFAEHAKQLQKMSPVVRRQLDAVDKAIEKAGL